MYLSRYRDPATGAARVGLETADGQFHELACTDLPELLQQDAVAMSKIVSAPGVVVASPVVWLPPVAGRTEVWAAGVTYLRSREARVEESRVADVYSLVYEADRPELFFKSVAWRVHTDGDPIGIREDSTLNVPEPEVAVVVNAGGEIIGYTICNDVSSRSIEGANPLYLPQAKVYAGACALHRRIRLAEGFVAGELAISCAVVRGTVTVWSGTSNTHRMRRSFSDLVSWAFRGDVYPDGMVLSTGTGIVPDMGFTLQAGDTVTIEVTGIGSLSNVVRVGTAALR
ncbi:MAG: hypothetical protein B5766_12840 [Candidatus Lumbricidophila eiseniae]|uniref:Fumarylacetoacetase-like C-terminal domain-containing protein n=1 Tax=Candidatus Lumbricidiphila eiseniae TaxID=1969409 RepID=A0A2A6FMK5_9MICO|nr:MAG: hypothetical protein B5766_12840 [Candidatus Lumbricidophila eiseniae]